MKFLFDGPMADLAIFLAQHLRQICLVPYRCSAPTATTYRPGGMARNLLPPGEISLMHQHIVQRLTERIGQRYFHYFAAAHSAAAHHLLQQPCVGMPVGQRIVQQRQSFVRELERRW